MSTGRSDALIHHPGLPLPVLLKPHPRARRWKLRVDDERGLILVTCPPRGSRKAALIWATGQRAWIDAQLAGVAPFEPIEPGAMIPLEGVDTLLAWEERQSRVVRLEEGILRCGGQREAFARRILVWLRSRARQALSSDTAEMAERAGVTVRGVSVGDAGTRWGSCSASGAIRYNWRLILAPPHVRRWVVAHEVAHRIHMNHGPAFKALEAELYGGDGPAARSELRRIGPRLKRIGRGD